MKKLSHREKLKKNRRSNQPGGRQRKRCGIWTMNVCPLTQLDLKTTTLEKLTKFDSQIFFCLSLNFLHLFFSRRLHATTTVSQEREVPY